MIGGNTIESFLARRQPPKNIAAANDNGNLHAERVNVFDLASDSANNVGIDAKAGRVAPRGTGAELLAITAQDLTMRVAGLGARTVIYNEVTRDGMLQGPDIEGAKSLAAAGVEVIVSGGVGSLEHLRAVKAARLAGACVGRALYDGKFTVREALACLS